MQRLVAELLAEEWDMPRDETESLVATVAADLARQDLDNHFHEAVPFAQFALMLLEDVGARPPAREDEYRIVAATLARRFDRLGDEEPTPELVAGVAEKMRAEGATGFYGSAISDYARFGLRLLWRLRDDPAADAPAPGDAKEATLLRRLLRRR